MKVEVFFATPEKQCLRQLTLDNTSTVLDAILAANFTSEFPDYDFLNLKCGIFGRCVTHDTRLKHNDRVELYRELICDPKKARRERSKK